MEHPPLLPEVPRGSALASLAASQGFQVENLRGPGWGIRIVGFGFAHRVAARLATPADAALRFQSPESALGDRSAGAGAGRWPGAGGLCLLPPDSMSAGSSVHRAHAADCGLRLSKFDSLRVMPDPISWCPLRSGYEADVWSAGVLIAECALRYVWIFFSLLCHILPCDLISG